MLEPASLMTRIIVGKGIGFVVGLIGFTLLPLIMADPGWLLRLGVLFWYTTVGAVIAVFGVFTWHPILKLPMPWWFRAPLIGGWMNFVLTFFAYDDLLRLFGQLFGSDGFIQSPFWIVAEGMLVGLLIGYFATKFGGEGPAIADT